MAQPNQQTERTMLIIDGHSLAYRMFYAYEGSNLKSSNGQSTGAVYGFASKLVKYLKDQRPELVAVAFDMSRRSFRTEIYPEYKAGRKPTPPEFPAQLPLIKQLLDLLGVTRLELPDYEADDILASLARVGSEDGYRVKIVTGDRDAFQLINSQVTVIYPGKAGQERELDPKTVEENYLVPPERYPELAALTGEQADNLPGVAGVGPKTAAQWLKDYGWLEGIYANLSAIPGVRGKALRAQIDNVRRNRKLNRLRDDLDLGIKTPDLRLANLDQNSLNDFFNQLNFGAGIRRSLDEITDLWTKNETLEKLNIPWERI